MSNTLDPTPNPDQSLVYQIRVQGHLGHQWTDWFDGLTITLENNGDTLLSGPVFDQAALHGLLKKVRDLGIPLVSVNRVEPHRAHPLGRIELGKGREKRMKAILYTHYGPPDVLQIQEVEKPKPKDQQVLVKVQAASVNALDWRPFTMPSLLIRLMSGGLSKPKDPKVGVDVAGTVEAVGKEVTEFQPGDEVFGVAPGSFAEYVANDASKFARKPAKVSFEAAAAVPVAAFTALQGLRDHRQIQPGQKVLIAGASGGVGLYAVQLAKAFGAEVTAVCRTRNLDLVCSLGADHAIDYTREDFTSRGQRYDFIYAVNGYHPLLAYRRALNPNGICIVAGGSFSQIIQALLFGPLISKFGNKQIGFQGIASTSNADLLVIQELLETGKIVPVIDKCYPLSETAEAIKYLIEEHGRGKVVITVGRNN
jgi:NADPH:quinone reductase-like Zn-dependent oxidoreductase